MKRLRQILATILLGAAIAALSVAPAWAFTLTGASATERQWIAEDMMASALDIAALDAAYHPVRIIIADEWPPYWDLEPGVEVISMDVLQAAIGLAYSDGTIVIKGALAWGPRSMALEVLNHELVHLWWFRQGTYFWAAWREYITEGLTVTEASWYTNSAEAFAEHGRRYWWGRDWWVTERPRTHLRVLTEAEFLAWVAEHSAAAPTTTTTLPPTTTTTIPPTTTTTAPPPPPTTTTLPRGDPWPDVAREDTELWEAAWWARDHGVATGFLDGTLGPYEPLTRRHAALMIGRAGGPINVYWVFDYGTPTRGELAERYPGFPWDSERWAETLLRSQLLRLIYRTEGRP